MLLKLVSKVLVGIQETNLKTTFAGFKTGNVFLFNIRLGRECSGLSLCPWNKKDLQGEVKQRESCGKQVTYLVLPGKDIGNSCGTN